MWTQLKQTMQVAVAGLSLGVVAAPAANPSLQNAEVPFPFTVGGRQMEAGRYEVHRASAVTFLVRHAGSGRSAMLQAPVQQRAGGSPAKLAFRCYAEGCALFQLTMPQSRTAYSRMEPSGRKGRSQGPYTVAVVRAGVR